MALTVKLQDANGTDLLDISSYLKLFDEGGIDPFPQFEEPAFMDAPLGEGAPLTNVDEKNSEKVLPMWLVPAAGSRTKDQLQALVVQVGRAMNAAKRLYWQDDGSSTVSYFDITYCRFEPGYRYNHAKKAWLAGTLRVYSQPPFAHTGTTRLIASMLASSNGGTHMAGPTIPAGSVVGDVPARVKVSILPGERGGNSFGPLGRIAGVAALPTGYLSWVPAASMVNLHPLATVAGASGAPASQAVTPATISLASVAQFCQLPLSAGVHAGRNRLIGIIQPANAIGLAVTARTDAGEPLGPTAMAQGLRGFQYVDLGVANVPTTQATSLFSIGAGVPIQTPADQYLALGVGANLGGFGAVLGRLAGVMVFPEDTLRLSLDPGQLIQGRWFAATGVASAYVRDLTDDFGNTYTQTPSSSLLSPTGVIPGYAIARLPYSPQNVRRRMIMSYRQTTGSNIGIGVAGEDLSYTLGGNVSVLGGVGTGFISVTAGGTLFASAAIASQQWGATNPLMIDLVRQAGDVYMNVRVLNATGITMYFGGATTMPVACVGFSDVNAANQLSAYAYDYVSGSAALIGHWTEALGPPPQASDMYVLDGTGQSYRAPAAGGSGILNLDDKIRGGALTVDPLVHKVIGFTGARDGGPLNSGVEVQVRMQERFRFVRG